MVTGKLLRPPSEPKLRLTRNETDLMTGLVDIHCHLYAGLDDGPQTHEEVWEMCRIAWEEGTRGIAATAHQNERWADNSAERIREAAEVLRQQLAEQHIPLEIFPTGEVMVWPGLEEAWQRGELMSVGDMGKYLLIELPGGMFLDLRDLIQFLVGSGVRPIIAHPERHPELLFDEGTIDEWIRLGCLVQVSTRSLTHAPSSRELKAIKSWVQRGVVHLLGSDGHSPRQRQPRMAAAYRFIEEWAGAAAAHQIGVANGWKVLHGEDFQVPLPGKCPKRSFWRFWD